MRRKRFTAELENKETGELHERCILAWNPATVEIWYEEHRPQDRVLRVTLTPKRYSGRCSSRPIWEADQDRLLRAYDTLDIRWPVEIRRTFSREHQGSHRLKIHGASPTPTHMIVVDKLLTPYHASRVLWHELAHAAQSERAAREEGSQTARGMKVAWVGASLRSRKIPYKERPCEIEANYVENLHLNDILTRAAR